MTEPLALACYCGVCATCGGGAPRPAVADPVIFRHGAIKQRLLDEIGSVQVDGLRPLAGLGTREDDDPAIALVDAVSGSLHILAWAAGRLSDDGSILRTRDRDALVDLAGLLGYQPRPALAATTTLSFTLDERDGAPRAATIPANAKIASVPGQGEMPQTFETDAALEARAEWNALVPVLAKTVPPVTLTTGLLVIAGTATPAKVGDQLLAYLEPQPPFADKTNWLLASIAAIAREPNPESGAPFTRLMLTGQKLLQAPTGMTGDGWKNQVILLGQRAAAFGATAVDLQLLSDKVRESQNPAASPPPPPGTLATEWKNLVMDPSGKADGGSLDLDAVYPDALPGRVTVFAATSGALTQMGLITAAHEGSRRDFGQAAKVSHITVKDIDLSDSGFKALVRGAVILLETGREQLLVSDKDAALPADADPTRIVVVGKVELPVGRRLVLTGEQWTATPGKGPLIGEVATLRASSAVGPNTELVFERAIAGRFRALTLRLLANSIGASHGVTQPNGPELIGSGNASVASPRFALKGAPLAYVPADNPRGYAPAIAVRVGERLYDERPTLFGLDSRDRAYTVRTGREGVSEVQFAGRLPSGLHNVSAAYRVGGGLAGNLAAGRIATALEPVVGVSAVSNAVPAEGASNAETIEDMRASAPQSIRTLDRVVSLTDFEAFASRYRGVGKALASELHSGMRLVVCLTIATTGLTSPVAGSDIVVKLGEALKGVMPPGHKVRIEGFTDLNAAVTLKLATDPTLPRAAVEAAVRAALGAAFGRAVRAFGQGLHRSEVLAVVQGVEGVLAANLTAFSLPGGPPEVDGRLIAPLPRLDGGVFNPAGLLSIDPAQVQFGEMKP